MCGTILWVSKQDDSTTLQSIYSMHWWPSFQRRRIEICRRIVTCMLSNCSQKCLCLARVGRPDILWSVNKLARSIKKWTKACDKRLNRLISYIHHTCEYKQYCYVGNIAKQCRLGLFQDSDFAGDLEDSKSTSGGTLCVLGTHTFVPISWMCKKQISFSHSSPESEIISLDAGLRLHGIPALDLWDPIVAVLGNTTQNHTEQGGLLKNKREACSPRHTIQKRKQSQRVMNVLDNVDFIPSNVQSSHQEALLYVFEDNEAVIKMIIKGRSPTMRRVSRSHRVALDWLFDRINLDSKIQIQFIDTKTNSQTYWPRETSHVMNGIIFCVCLTSAISVLQIVLKWCRKENKKFRPMMNLVSRCSERTPDVLASTASESSGKTRYESQIPLSSWTEQHLRTGRLVVYDYSSSYSEWNVDKTWSSQEWKSDEVMEDRTVRLAVTPQHTERFTVENDKMNSGTEAESEMSLESTSFLHRVDDQMRKRQNQSSKDALKTATNILW